MLLIGTFWWTPDAGSKFAAAYTVQDVLRLQRAVAKHCTVEHQFVVITDQPHLFTHVSNLVRAVPLDKTTHVPGTCYTRLMTFHPDGPALFGAERLLQIDLDTLIVGNIDHLGKRLENIILWRNPARVPWDETEIKSQIYRNGEGQLRYANNTRRCYYNTSVLMHRLGSMPWIWEDFVTRRDNKMPLQAKDDQWLLSDHFGNGAPYFDGARDGVYRLARADTPGSGVDGELPDNACICTFPGSDGKWVQPEIREANPWINAHL